MSLAKAIEGKTINSVKVRIAKRRTKKARQKQSDEGLAYARKHEVKFDEDGRCCLAPRKLREYMGIGEDTMYRLIKEGKLGTVPLNDGYGREAEYIVKDDATKELKNILGKSEFPELPGRIAVACAAKSFGMSEDNFKVLRRKVGVKSTQINGAKGSDGHTRPRFYISINGFEKIEKLLAWGEDDCTINQAAEILKVSKDSVRIFVRNGLLRSDGHYIRGADERVTLGRRLSRKEVASLHAARLKNPPRDGHLWIDPRSKEEKAEARREPEAKSTTSPGQVAAQAAARLKPSTNGSVATPAKKNKRGPAKTKRALDIEATCARLQALVRATPKQMTMNEAVAEVERLHNCDALGGEYSVIGDKKRLFRIKAANHIERELGEKSSNL